MASEADRTRLIASVVRFLKDEMASKDTTPDKAESLEVAIQCLSLAYDVEDDEKTKEPKLLDVYLKAVPREETKPVSDDDRKKAEDFKQQGNELMKSETYDKAIEKYTQAIEVDPQSAVYHCNRAAAYTGLGQHESALNDCRKAVRIDKNYSKAYSRMGLIYSKLEKYDAAVECYDKALQLDPNNEGYKNNMKIASEKMKETSAAAAFPGFGGMGGMADMLNNPMLMNMAQQVMANPEMQRMAMNMMGSFMGGQQPEGEGGDTPQPPAGMADMLRMGQQFAEQVSQENPELVEQLRNEIGKPDDKSNTDQ